jgi:hypothetical protein
MKRMKWWIRIISALRPTQLHRTLCAYAQSQLQNTVGSGEDNSSDSKLADPVPVIIKFPQHRRTPPAA